MKTIRVTLAALSIAIVFNSTGCMTRQERYINEPAGASAVYRNGDWQPVDRSHFRQIETRPNGYYDSRGMWHPFGTGR